MEGHRQLLDSYRARSGEPILEMPFERAMDIANAALGRRMAVEPSLAVEAALWWYLPITWIGCVGVLVDKSSGSAHVLGSAVPLELWLWASNKGFRDPSDFVLQAVLDRPRALDLLDQLQLVGLAELPPRPRLRGAERTDGALAVRRRQRNRITSLRQRQLEAIVDGALPISLRACFSAWSLQRLREVEANLPVRYALVPRPSDDDFA
jgi:hypothetical protein